MCVSMYLCAWISWYIVLMSLDAWCVCVCSVCVQHAMYMGLWMDACVCTLTPSVSPYGPSMLNMRGIPTPNACALVLHLTCLLWQNESLACMMYHA